MKRGYTAQREWHKAMLVKTIDEIGPSVTHKSLFKHARICIIRVFTEGNLQITTEMNWLKRVVQMGFGFAW